MVQRRNNIVTNLLLPLIGLLSLTIVAAAQQKKHQVPEPGAPDAKQQGAMKSEVADDSIGSFYETGRLVGREIKAPDRPVDHLMNEHSV